MQVNITDGIFCSKVIKSYTMSIRKTKLQERKQHAGQHKQLTIHVFLCKVQKSDRNVKHSHLLKATKTKQPMQNQHTASYK